MNTQTAQKQTNLFDVLQGLLEKQLVSLKNGDLLNSEALARQADTLIAEMAKTKMSRPEHNLQYENLRQLYKKMELMIEAEKDSINRQLVKVQNGKKTVRAYQNGI